MKINKSQLAKEFGVDRRTIDKYLNGFIPKRKRNKPSKIDKYYEVIAALLSFVTAERISGLEWKKCVKIKVV